MDKHKQRKPKDGFQQNQTWASLQSTDRWEVQSSAQSWGQGPTGLQGPRLAAGLIGPRIRDRKCSSTRGSCRGPHCHTATPPKQHPCICSHFCGSAVWRASAKCWCWPQGLRGRGLDIFHWIFPKYLAHIKHCVNWLFLIDRSSLVYILALCHKH